MKEIREMMSAFDGEDGLLDEEKFFSLYYLYHPESVALDDRCRLFLPTGRVERDEVEITSEGVSLNGRRPFPCIVVGPAGEGSIFEEIYKKVIAP